MPQVPTNQNKLGVLLCVKPEQPCVCCRYGVVLEACYKYLCERTARAPAELIATPDLVTYVPFDHEASIHIDAEEQSATSAPVLLQKMMQKKPRGASHFGRAIAVAYKHLKRVRAAVPPELNLATPRGRHS